MLNKRGGYKKETSDYCGNENRNTLFIFDLTEKRLMMHELESWLSIMNALDAEQ